ncbi:MAG: hypothetical protein Q8R10_10375 [Pseudomonas sp.]|uniref:hypothetical protein n=1 Tax=Pseudomonas sp. TaxID=306 RepID=UPI0027338130|nr:hypothetical protein [Pseudomonas sp.]MDP3846811.1 hypothetical protein [Pseudomonas sp.]
MTLQRLIYALALIAVLWLGRAILQGPAPLPLTSTDGSLQLADYRITPLEAFSLEARVLGREDYHFDRGAAISPTDLALGWGPMAEPQVLDKIRISQSNRWYRWQVDEFPIPRREIETHSANMHMIPANSLVADTLARVTSGQRIQLSGQLVRVDGKDGYSWSSSLSRDDTGAGACELIWVEQLRLLD